MKTSAFNAILALLIVLVFLTGIVYLFFLIIRALKTYIRSQDIRQEKRVIKQTLGETLKACREQCKMTQEFVAEAIGVSRQAVSKWETGASDPSTSNLLALAQLYSVSPEELLNAVKERRFDEN